MVAQTLGIVSFYIVAYTLYIFAYIDRYLFQILLTMSIIFVLSYFFHDYILAVFGYKQHNFVENYTVSQIATKPANKATTKKKKARKR